MTPITITNQTFESQKAQTITLQEGPITTIPSDVTGYILFLTNHSERHSEMTRLVSRDWNDLTLAAVKNKRQDIEQTISLIIKTLNPDTQAQYIAALTELQVDHQSKSGDVGTFPKARQAFFTGKGLLVGILRKLPKDEKDQLLKAIGEELPDSMKDIFKISCLDFETIVDVDIETFYTLLQSYQPLSMIDRGSAVLRNVCSQKIEFVKLLLADGPTSDDIRGLAVDLAAVKENLELVRLLLADGPISDDDRGVAVNRAVVNKNLELVRLLLANGPISSQDRGWLVKMAATNNNLELVSLLLANGPISSEDRGWALQEVGLRYNNLELVNLLLADGPIPHGDRRLTILAATTLNKNLELAQVLTDKWVIAELGVGAAFIGGMAWVAYKIYKLYK